jgi:hypothetical protein
MQVYKLQCCIGILVDIREYSLSIWIHGCMPSQRVGTDKEGRLMGKNWFRTLRAWVSSHSSSGAALTLRKKEVISGRVAIAERCASMYTHTHTHTHTPVLGIPEWSENA